MVEKIEGIKMERTHVTVVKWDMHAVTVLVVAEFGYGLKNQAWSMNF